MARGPGPAYSYFMSAAPQRSPRLIGIVDDDRGVIRSEGFRTAVFSSGEECLGSEDLRNAGCLILDVRMPRMSGLDLQTRLSEMSWRVPIIFASAYSDVDIQSKALDNGAIAFLYKPFFAEALLAAVDLALSQYITGAP